MNSNMSIIGYANNTTGSSIVLTDHTLPTGISIVFYKQSFYTRDNYIALSKVIESEDLILQDINDVDLTPLEAINFVNDIVNDMIAMPVYVPYAFNAIIGKYIISLINNYIADNSGDSVSHDFVIGLLMAINDGQKAIALDYITRLTDPFYSTVFKDKITDLITEGFL